MVHGATFSRKFDFTLGLIVELCREPNLGAEFDDTARLIAGHFLIYLDAHPSEIDPELFHLHANNRGHARTERGRTEISRGGSFAFTIIINGGVSSEGLTGRFMADFTPQRTFIFNCHLDHWSEIVKELEWVNPFDILDDDWQE